MKRSSRSVASAVGGLPVDMRLVNSTKRWRRTRRSGAGRPPTIAGRIGFHGDDRNQGRGDLLRYGHAGPGLALGNALKSDGYFQDRGVTVLLNMGATADDSFVVRRVLEQAREPLRLRKWGARWLARSAASREGPTDGQQKGCRKERALAR